MTAEEFIQQYYKGERLQQHNANELIRELIAHKATEDDNEITIQLMTNLILQYSEAEKNLIQLNNLKNKFLGMASHDLRNPIVSIRGFSEMFLNEELGPLNDEQKEFMGVINKVSNEMLGLLNDLLDISAIESGKFELVLKMAQIKLLLQERIRLMESIAKAKGISIQTELSETADTLFDYGRIAQVVDNLVSNAIKFSPYGKIVYVYLSQIANEVVIKVRDEGHGIPIEEQPRLFGEFQKLSTRPTGGEKSTGLGLSIAKKIVEAHNGKIWVESSTISGTTFAFNLPLTSH